MYRRELLILGGLLAAIFLIVAFAGAFMMRVLQHQAQMVVIDTLPGLINSGEAISRLDYNWEKIRSLPTLPSSEQRLAVMSEVESNSAAEFWRRYEESIFDKDDQRFFSAMQTARSNYWGLVHQYFDLVRSKKLGDADQMAEQKLEGVFKQYRTTAMDIFRFNEQVANERSSRITALNHWLPVMGGVVTVLIFGVGFSIGLRGAFTGLEFVLRPKRRRGSV